MKYTNLLKSLLLAMVAMLPLLASAHDYTVGYNISENGITMGTNAQNKISYIPDARIEQRVEQTLSRLTLEQKVGQMTELVIDVLGHWEGDNFVLDKDKLEQALTKYQVGSILNAPGPVAQTPEWWHYGLAHRSGIFCLLCDIQAARSSYSN